MADPRNQLVPLQVIGDQQHHQARALLEDRGLLVKADSPGGAIGPLGLAYGFSNLHGALWVRPGHEANARQAIEDAGLFVAGAQRPIVDRSEPVCPTCGGELHAEDDDEGACASCGLQFYWVDINEPDVDPHGLTCTECGYELTGNTAGRCPECGAPIVVDVSQVVELASQPADESASSASSSRGPSIGVLVIEFLIVVALAVVFVMLLTRSGPTIFDDILSTILVIAGTIVLICTLMYFGDKARRRAIAPDDAKHE